MIGRAAPDPPSFPPIGCPWRRHADQLLELHNNKRRSSWESEEETYRRKAKINYTVTPVTVRKVTLLYFSFFREETSRLYIYRESTHLPQFQDFKRGLNRLHLLCAAGEFFVFYSADVNGSGCFLFSILMMFFIYTTVEPRSTLRNRHT